MKIVYKEFEYIRKLGKIKIGDWYCTTILDDNGKLKQLIVSKCQCQASADFNNKSHNSFKLLSTNNPEYQEIYDGN